MSKSKFEDLIDYIKSLVKEKHSIKNLIAEIYNLFQESMISEDEESYLYSLIDPDEKINNPAELWFDGYGCSELYDFARTL